MVNTDKISLTEAGILAIQTLQHKAGTYEYYRNAISRIAHTILHMSDELGMSNGETVSTLRALDSIAQDLADIAGRQFEDIKIEEDWENDD